MSMVKESKSALHIRYASATDNILLAEMGTATFSDSFAAANTPEDMAVYLAESFNPRKLAQELANRASTFLIGEADGLAVAYAHLKFGQAPAAVVSRKPMRFVLTVMEGAVMQARSYQCIEPFDDCIDQLRAYFGALEELGRRKINLTHRPGVTRPKRRRR